MVDVDVVDKNHLQGENLYRFSVYQSVCLSICWSAFTSEIEINVCSLVKTELFQKEELRYKM